MISASQTQHLRPRYSLRPLLHIQLEIGPFLDGSLKVIEGRGYDPDGKVTFNALGIISVDEGTGAYMMRSYALEQGRLRAQAQG